MGAQCSKVGEHKVENHMRRAEMTNNKLTLVNARLEPESFAIIASFLEASTLSELNLAQNNGGDAGVMHLAPPLANNFRLHRLVLSDNEVGDGSMQTLVDNLLQNRHLKDLDLHNNNIGPRGAQQLARLLRYTHHLESLLLGSNNIGDKGVRLICNGCKLNHRSKIHKLGLSANGISNIGATKVCKLVEKYSHTITSVELGFNLDITDRGLMELIKKDCQKNKEFSAIKGWERDTKNRKNRHRNGKVEDLTQAQLNEFKDAFRMFDRDGDNTIEAEELADVLQEIGHTAPEEKIKDMMQDADGDGSGVIEQAEFIEMMARQMAGSESDSNSDTDGEENTSDDDIERSPSEPAISMRGPSMVEKLNPQAAAAAAEKADPDDTFANPLAHQPKTAVV